MIMNQRQIDYSSTKKDQEKFLDGSLETAWIYFSLKKTVWQNIENSRKGALDWQRVISRLGVQKDRNS